MDRVCPMCGDSNETVVHALLTCPEVSIVGKSSPLRLDIARNGVNSFMDWIMGRREVFRDMVWWDIFWSLLWGIWMRRNTLVFKERRLDHMDVILKVVSLVDEFAKANKELVVTIWIEQAGGETWQVSEEGTYKINSDAALCETGMLELGGVIRGHLGYVMVATCLGVHGRMEVDVAEAIAARHALRIALEAGSSSIILDSNNLKLINHSKRSAQEHTSFWTVVSDILWLGSLCSILSFIHVRRKGNKVPIPGPCLD